MTGGRQHSSTTTGAGPEILFVHGGVAYGELCWAQQASLAETFKLTIIDRCGYAPDEVGEAEDCAEDARILAELLRERPLHLVGQSAGAVVAAAAASAAPEQVLSLTLCEPPFFNLPEQSVAAQTMLAEIRALIADTNLADGPWASTFAGIVGSVSAASAPNRRLLQGVATVRAASAGPWSLKPDFDALRQASFPKLVLSGDHSQAFEDICDALAERIGAERAHVRGKKHSTPLAADEFNALVARTVTAGEKRHLAGLRES